jgi:hypothetical protein
MAPLCAVLRSLPPCFISLEEPAHKLRAAVLDMLGRLPQSEAMRPHAPALFDACLGVLQNDNQENAITAVKLMFDLLKAHKQGVEASAAAFQDTILTVCVCAMHGAVWWVGGRGLEGGRGQCDESAA